MKWRLCQTALNWVDTHNVKKRRRDEDTGTWWYRVEWWLVCCAVSTDRGIGDGGDGDGGDKYTINIINSSAVIISISCGAVIVSLTEEVYVMLNVVGIESGRARMALDGE